MLIDYHIHTHASFDCFEHARAMCESALKAGMDAVAFTDHVDFLPDRPLDWQTDLAAAFREIDEVAEQFLGVLEVARGVEIGQPQFNEREARRLHEEFSPDFIIGSIHYLDPTYDMGMSGVADRDPVALFIAYLEMVKHLAQYGDYDVLGHLTYPWRYFKRERDYDFRTENYLELFVEIFDIVVERGRGLEVNTSGLRQPLADTLPNERILALFRQCGGRFVTTGSDAHTPDHVGDGIEEATAMIRRVGFEGISTYRDRIPTIQPFAKTE